MVSIRMREKSDKQMTMQVLATLLIAFIVLAASPIPESRGIPEYSRELPEALKSFCQVCHVRASGGPMNSFGDDYVSYGSSVGAIGELDSDDDGFRNEDELAAGSLPGDPDSTPTSKKTGINLIYVMGGASLLLVAAGFALRRRRNQASK
jgi:MYXO-CTERM domain-containing protein